MKRRNALMALVLGLALIFGTCTSVFAATGPATDVTKKAIADAGVQCVQKINNEVDAEKIAINFGSIINFMGFRIADISNPA